MAFSATAFSTGMGSFSGTGAEPASGKAATIGLGSGLGSGLVLVWVLVWFWFGFWLHSGCGRAAGLCG